MIVYLSSPGNAMHADKLCGRDVLLSYPVAKKQEKWLPDYIPSFGRLLLDSGAFTEFNSGKPIDLAAYGEWAEGMSWAKCALPAGKDGKLSLTSNSRVR